MIRPLPRGWNTTRTTLQRYAQAVTAFPRAAAAPHPRWSHVAMEPIERGFSSAPMALADGTALESVLDLVDHHLIVRAGGDQRSYDLTTGPSPSSIGQAILQLADDHGSAVDADPARFEDDTEQVYDPSHARAFLESSIEAVAAMRDINAEIVGEVAGPHLWPHGFDIATEWYSTLKVDGDGGEANAQIAAGWYPVEDGYVYVNPWPFDGRWASAELPHGAKWHLEGWQGAELAIATDGLERTALVDLVRRVRDLAGPSLGT